MKSRFKYGAYILAVLAVVFSIMLCLALSVDFFIVIPLPIYIILNLFCIFCWVWLVYGELRTKVIHVEIGYDNFISKGYFGFGRSKTYYFADVEGYRTSILPASQGAVYEYLYVIVDGKKVIKLSQFYHKNYGELKTAISETNIKYFGEEDFSYWTELKEIFT